MPEISITQTPSGTVRPDTLVTLAVAVSPDPTRYTYTWELADGSQADGRAIVVTASRRTEGRYRVTAAPKRAGGEPLTADHTLQLAGQSSQAASRLSNSGGPFAVGPLFAAGVGIAVLAFAVVLLAPLAYRLYNTDAPDAVDRLATLTTMALLGIGVLVLLLGVYLALLEVRGRLASQKAQGDFEANPAVDGPDLTNSTPASPIGRLGGPVILLLVIGCVPLILAAWVAQSGEDRDSGAAATPTARAATRTPSPVPSATTMPAP